MGTVRIEQSDGKLTVVAPYHPDFPAGAKRVGGRFEGAGKVWTFDAREEARVRKLCREVYGEDGEAEVDRVNMRVRLTYQHVPDVFALGRLLVSRLGRDKPVRLGEGVVLEEGNPDFKHSGGSVKNPAIDRDSTPRVLLVRDVPRALAEEAIAAEPEKFALEGAEFVVAPPPAPSDQQRRAQAEATVARLRAALTQAEVELAALAEVESGEEASEEAGAS